MSAAVLATCSSSCHTQLVQKWPPKTAEEVPRPKDHFTVKEVAEMFGMSVKGVRWNIQNGHLEAYKREWWYGVSYKRAAWFITAAAIKEWRLFNIVKKYVGSGR